MTSKPRQANRFRNVPARWLTSHSGQSLIIGALMFIVLLIAVPVMVFMNRILTQHGTASQQKLKGRGIAEEGVSFAMQQLAQVGNWPYPGNGTPSLLAPMTISSFTVTYTSAPNISLQSYQVGVLSRPLDWRGNVIPGSSLFTLVSQRTVGAKLPTGYSTSGALEITQAPPAFGANANLIVEWGPLICRDAVSSLPLDPLSDTSQRPRKFSASAIPPRCANAACPTPTDNKEYWAYTSPGFASVIDLTSYQTDAADLLKSVCTPPTCNGTCTGVGTGNPIPAAPLTSCYFQVPDDGTAVFGAGYPFSFPNSVIFVMGNAQFDDIDVNVSGTGAVIVTGNLTLGNNNPAYPLSGFAATTLPRPPAFHLDDPYSTCAGPPCNGAVDRHIDLRGFLYVGGNLTTTSNAVVTDGHWTIYGVARVDGQLTIAPDSSLAVFYNDVVNHTIRTTNFEVQIDSMTAIP